MVAYESKLVQLGNLFDHFVVELHSPYYVDVEFLVAIVAIIRPKRGLQSNPVSIEFLLDYLRDSDTQRKQLVAYLNRLLVQRDFDQLISDTGIISYADFGYELRKRIGERYLPYQPPKDTLQYLFNQVFYSPRDADWVAAIPMEQLEQLFSLCEFRTLYDQDTGHGMTEILYGLELLMQRITGRAMETDVNKMVPELRNFDSPFIAIMREFTELNDRILQSETKYITSSDLSYRQILVLHRQCENYIETAFENSHQFGISLKVNQSLLRIRQQLERIKEILSFLVVDTLPQKVEKTILLAITLIGYNSRKTNVRKLVNQSTQLLAYEITHHTAQTGEHYITSGRKDYWHMFFSACGGGFIVGAMCIVKLLLSNVDTSEFGHALLYSLNYAIGFTLIYLLGATLATKQPAMTASALVSAIEQGASDPSRDKYRYWTFAQFFARLFRSQFIAFVGNVIMAFPISFLLARGIQVFWDVNIASTKWLHLVDDLNPTKTHVILHASIAGVFLFLSGIIAGSVANRDKHNTVYYRIQEHPLLKRLFGRAKSEKIASFYEKKWAGIVSNLWFGVFMGSTASIGLFLGLDLDIRHITFASGNLALGLFGHDMRLTTDMWIWGILGIGIIGFLNFLVSFSLSLLLAFRSRNLSSNELGKMIKAVWAYFKMNPRLFFFPPAK